ncbi:hypothetical protein [Bradyrhizobium liaoningense]|nr:hypothetical protein [Bradyrhizobium liaoningense]
MESKNSNQESRERDDAPERGCRTQPAFNPPFAGEGLEQVRDPNC